MCGALFIGVGVVAAVPFGLYVDKTRKFMEVAKINLSAAALACVAFSVVRKPKLDFESPPVTLLVICLPSSLRCV